MPLLPCVICGTHRTLTKQHPRDLSRGKTTMINIGEPMTPSGEDLEAETAELHRRMRQLRRRDDPLPRRRAAARVLVAASVVRRIRPDP